MQKQYLEALLDTKRSALEASERWHLLTGHRLNLFVVLPAKD